MTCNNINSSLLKKGEKYTHWILNDNSTHLGIMLQLNGTAKNHLAFFDGHFCSMFWSLIL